MLMEPLGFIWMDSGNEPISRTLAGPGTDFAFFPTISFRKKIALENNTPGLHPKDTVYQSAQLLHTSYGGNMDPELTRIDAFYAFHKIFEFCAFSELQFLNLMEKQIEQYQIENCVKYHGKPTNGSDLSLESLQRFRTLVQKHIWQLEKTLSVIHSEGDPDWPRATHARDIKTTRAAADRLQKDYEHLLSRAVNIRQRCSDSIAQRIAQNAQTDYTKPVMALVCITFLTFTTSFFSMKFKELQNLSVWVYFVVSTPLILGLTTVSFFWPRLINLNWPPNWSRPGNKIPVPMGLGSGENDEERPTLARLIRGLRLRREALRTSIA